jgi:DNA-binding phage protein
MARRAKHVHRDLSPAERAKVAEARELTQQDEAEIRRKAKQYKHEDDAARAAIREAMQLLQAERIRQGLSLSDIQRKTGIEPPNLSRLENDHSANPTIATLTRYAEALGKKLEIVLTDAAV